MAWQQRSIIAGYFWSSTMRRRQTRRLREMQPSPRYMPSRYEYGAAGNAAKLWPAPHSAEPAGNLDRTCGRQRQSRTVGRGMPVSRAMAQSFMPAAISFRTVSNSSADRTFGPFAGCLHRRKRHRQTGLTSGYDCHLRASVGTGRRDGFRCHCPMGVGVRVPPRAPFSLRSLVCGPPTASPARADSRCGSARPRAHTPRRAARRPAAPRPSTRAGG